MILYEQEARDYLKKGVDILANAVKVTLGPCGSNVIVYKNGIPHVTKDGVTVAKSINDEEYKVGIELVRKVSEKTGNDAGDGTTTSTLLTQSIVELVYEKLKANPNLKPIYIKKGIDLVVKKIVDELEQMSIPVEDRIKQVAYISSNGDEEITSVVTEVMNKVKGTGMISLKSSDSNTYVTYSEGLKWETPYMNPNFVTNAVKMEVEYENCKVIIFDKKLEKLTQILPVLEKCKRANVPVLICVKDIEQDCLNTLVMNNLNGILKCCVVKIPGHENYRIENILDLQSIIGNSELVDKVIVTRESTFFINNKGNEETKAARIASLKHNLTLTDPNIEDINNRIANISNSFATIYVSGNSEVEIQEKIDRYDDAICAVKSALDEGIVPGGGNALYDIYRNIQLDEYKDSSIEAGIDCMIESLVAPIKQILYNGNAELPDKCNHIIYKDGEFYSVKSAIDNDVLDPTKVVRLTVENAASIAGAIITTKCIVI